MDVDVPALQPAERDELIQEMNERWGYLIPVWDQLHSEIRDDLVIQVLVLLVDRLKRMSLRDHTICFDGYEVPKKQGLMFFSQLNEEERKSWNACVHYSMTHDLPDRWDALFYHSAIRCPVRHELAAAYKTNYVGNSANEFVSYIKMLEDEDIFPSSKLYAKSVPVVQSSGTGKSRMLTEVGNIIFTLPICFRRPADPGYPRSDTGVWEYFEKVFKGNNLSIRGHHAAACFIAAAHGQMLASLQELKGNEPLDAESLRKRWHECMDMEEEGTYRRSFFERVKVKAEKLYQDDCPLHGISPHPDKPLPKGFEPPEMARQIYNKVAKKATRDLTDFITNLANGKPALCLTYIDEAHELQELYWVLLRLLSHQDPTTGMWYSFMRTKSELHYYAPMPQDMRSLRLSEETKVFLPPFFALPFDIHASSAQLSEVKNYFMGQFLTVEHTAQYGRPLWHAQIQLLCDEDREVSLKLMVQLAKAKLLADTPFRPGDIDHVFTILSQRICLEPTLANGEATSLADRSVANHMRLLTGVSRDRSMLHTYSPSEPILALGAISILYNAYRDAPLTRNSLSSVLTTFTRGICNTGLIPKGQLGEVAARFLLLTARDFTAINQENGDFLKPVRFLDVLDSLLHVDAWDQGARELLETRFAGAYVNFTHWIVTEEGLPNTPDEDLLANLWSRNAILQCSHNQESHDFVAAVYCGDVADDAVFDPTKLTPFYGQFKLRRKASMKAARLLRAMGIPRVENLPHFALLMDLGTESRYKNGSKIQTVVSSRDSDEEFRSCQKAFRDAQVTLLELEDEEEKDRADIDAQKKVVKEKQQAMDTCNRYLVSVRGASPGVYRVLEEAKIATEFQRLLDMVDPLDFDRDDEIQTMMPLRQFNRDTPYTAWMHHFVKDPKAMLVDK